MTFILLQLKVPFGNMNCLPVTLLVNMGLHSITSQQRQRLLELSEHLLIVMELLMSHLSILTHLFIFELNALLIT